MADSDDDWRVTLAVSQPQAGQEQQSASLRQAEEDIRRRVGRGIGVGAGVELGSHRQAVALARTLEGGGRAIVRRWKFLLVGAANEDEARELAAQLGRVVPADAAVKVEMSGVGWPFPPS